MSRKDIAILKKNINMVSLSGVCIFRYTPASTGSISKHAAMIPFILLPKNLCRGA